MTHLLLISAGVPVYISHENFQRYDNALVVFVGVSFHLECVQQNNDVSQATSYSEKDKMKFEKQNNFYCTTLNNNQ